MNKNKWRQIPNILTVLRFLAVPVMAVWMIEGKWTASLILFVSAELTDILDGYIARKYQFITDFGKLADPLADKVLQLTALFLLARGERLPYYFFYILAAKELAMIVGAIVFLQKKVVVSSNWSGKAAAAIVFSGNVLAFLNKSIAVYVIWIGVFVALMASAIYLKQYVGSIKKTLR